MRGKGGVLNLYFGYKISLGAVNTCGARVSVVRLLVLWPVHDRRRACRHANLKPTQPGLSLVRA